MLEHDTLKHEHLCLDHKWHIGVHGPPELWCVWDEFYCYASCFAFLTDSLSYNHMSLQESVRYLQSLLSTTH